MKLIVYEAATSNDTPHENQGTKREVVIPEFGAAQERCQALVCQFHGYCHELACVRDAHCEMPHVGRALSKLSNMFLCDN